MSKILLVDELTAVLDPEARHIFFKVIHELKTKENLRSGTNKKKTKQKLFKTLSTTQIKNQTQTTQRNSTQRVFFFLFPII